MPALSSTEAEKQKERRTVVAVVDVHAVTVVKALERAREVDMEIVVAGVFLVLDAREVFEQVLVDVECERPRCEPLVVDRGVERECFVDDVDDLGVCYMWGWEGG